VHRRTWIIPAAIALLGLFAGLSFWEMADDSLTVDEGIHLPVGYAYWKRGEFRLNPEHPPLVKLLCSAPLLLMDLRLPPTEPERPGDFHAYQGTFARRFLHTQDTDRILFWGRIPVVVLGLILAGTVFWWSWRIHGHPGAGLLSLFLIALEPTTLAHSHYVTMDVALAAFAILAFASLWEFSRQGGTGPFVLAVLAMGSALASKFSAIFLLPVFLFLIVVRWPAGGLAAALERAGVRGRAAPLLAAVAAVIGMAAIVQASYFFSPDLSLYLKGIEAVIANHPTNYPAYAFGRFFIGGVFWYPLYAFLLKTPIPTLVAIGVALVSCFRRAERASAEFLFILLPAFVLTLATCLLADNYGLRYLIPVTALLLVLGGRAFLVVGARRGRRAAAGLLAAWLAASVLIASPHFIAYFNESIGGPRNAPFFLHDSNVDWGQDLERLARYQSQNGVPEIILAYWGQSRPEYYAARYGVRYVQWSDAMGRAANPPPGVYALSVNHLVNLKLAVEYGDNPNLDWLERFRPAARVGYSIYIYRFPPAAPPP
jgi:hypothetical protein